MIIVENLACWGFEAAIRGMRNPMNSWEKSDSYVDQDGTEIGPNDLALMKKLCHAGPEHRKFMRQIFISMDITAPLYWWKEFDQYKVGVVTDSCSTMHTIAAREFESGDFSHEHIRYPGYLDLLGDIIDALNEARDLYLRTKDKDNWWEMIQLLPSSYNQKRTVTMSYENAWSIIHQRKGHKLDEWNRLCDVLETLPYMEDLIGKGGVEK